MILKPLLSEDGGALCIWAKAEQRWKNPDFKVELFSF
jgi:hypothetical protein